MSTLIKGGHIVTAVDDYVGDILIEGESIAAIGAPLDVQAERVIDASGKYVIPGAIDPHTHMEMPFGGTVSCDDFTSGTVSAAFGGTTSLIDFCLQAVGQSIPDALSTWYEKIDRCPPVIDVGFHMAITDLHDGGRLEDVAAVPDEGVTSYKLFMAYKGAIMVDDEALFKTMQVAAKTGALVMVHAENGDAIDVNIDRLLAAGHTSPRFHPASRPPVTEAEAVNRAVSLAALAGCPMYIVHLSSAEALDALRRCVYADAEFVLGQFALAQLLARTGQTARARKALDNVTRLLAARPLGCLDRTVGLQAARVRLDPVSRDGRFGTHLGFGVGAAEGDERKLGEDYPGQLV